MIPEIRIEYHDHQIAYREEKDVWVCRVLSMEASSLAALKAKIDKFDADLRRLPGVPVLFIGSHISPGPSFEEWGATLLAEGEKEVWLAKTKRKGTPAETKVREKRSLSGLVLDTPENRQALEEAHETYRRGAELQTQARAMQDMIPRVTATELRTVSERWEEALNANS